MSSQLGSDPAVYNEMYLHDDRTYDDPSRSPYLPIFRAVVDEARLRELTVKVFRDIIAEVKVQVKKEGEQE